MSSKLKVSDLYFCSKK